MCKRHLIVYVCKFSSDTNADIASTENGILLEKSSSSSDVSEGSESPNNTLKAEFKKIHELKMKSMDNKIEDPSNI